MDRFNSRKDTAEERIRELKAEEMIQNEAQRYKEMKKKEKKLESWKIQ